MAGQAHWRTWDLTGLTVTQLRFDYSFTIHIWSGERELRILLGSPFVLRSPSGERQVMDPEQDCTLAPLLPLLHRPVASFAASSEGRCVLRFEDGTEIQAAPDPSYEAWEAAGGGELSDLQLLCGPGGGSPWG